MANIIDQITVGDQHLLVVDADPTVAPGLAVPVGSMAMFNNAGVGNLYFNSTGTALGWTGLTTTLETSSTVATTNNAATNIATVGTISNSTTELEVLTQAIRTGGVSGNAGDGAAFSHIVRCKNVAGILTLGTVQATYTDRDNVNYSVGFVTFGTVIVIQVKGPATTNVDWKSTIKYQSVT